MADTVAVILGSAFADGLGTMDLEPVEVKTSRGVVTLHRADVGRSAWVLFRHGRPHRWLPNQIPYRAHAWALREVGCGALLVTSSVGVLDAALPLHALHPVSDLLMPDNRLPDGSACSVFDTPRPDQGHLVLRDGLFSTALSGQLAEIAEASGHPLAEPVVFGYVGGPRTKTPAENRLWAQLGAQVNSMTLGPEVVLANELEIPCAGLVSGHKYSVPTERAPDEQGIGASLDASRAAFRDLVEAFLRRADPVPFGNAIYRF